MNVNCVCDTTLPGMAQFLVTKPVVVLTTASSCLICFFVALWVQPFPRSSAFVEDIRYRLPFNFRSSLASAFYLVYFFGIRRKLIKTRLAVYEVLGFV